MAVTFGSQVMMVVREIRRLSLQVEIAMTVRESIEPIAMNIREGRHIEPVAMIMRSGRLLRWIEPVEQLDRG